MSKKTLFILFLALGLSIASAAPVNILYLNSSRGTGTGAASSNRVLLANELDSYLGGGVFDVDFVQTHVAGNLATKINANAIDFYDQIWFDTTVLNTSLLNTADFTALNAWAAADQPEFILDSSYFKRAINPSDVTASSIAVTINEALALKNVGGGILIGTDHDVFTNTANQVLTNFGFDGLFTGEFNITNDGGFVGSLLLSPETVDNTFFTTNLQGLSTSNVPIGTHVLNANGGNRTIEVFENLFSNSPGRVSHIGASFNTGTQETDIEDVESFEDPVPEPSSIILFSLAGLLLIWKRK